MEYFIEFHIYLN